MNIRRSLGDRLFKEVRRIAAERGTTLNSMVREYLEQRRRECRADGRADRERETLERSFKQAQFKMGKRTWKRADLHGRATGRFAKQDHRPIR